MPYRPGPAGAIRCARASASSACRACYPQRQRQPAALGGQHGRRARLGVDSRPDQRPQQRYRVGAGQRVQSQPGRAVPGRQPGQRIAAGDQHRAAGGAGQQRPDLVGGAGVVGDDQDPFAGQQAAVPGGALVGLGRDVGARHAQRSQESCQCLGGRDRLAGVVAAQVDVQLPVGEPVRDLVRPVHGQRGLAYSRRSPDRADHHRRLRAGPVKQPGQRLQLGRAAGEPRHHWRQLPRRAPRGLGLRRLRRLRHRGG
jgi:hypothetical protein